MPEISFSKMKTFRRCSQAFEYKYNQKIRRKRPAAPLIRGNIIHEILDARMEQKPAEPILAAYEKKYKNLFLEEQEMFGELIPETRRIMEGYEREYARDDLIYEAKEEFVATNLTNDIRFVGYIDKRVSDKQGRRWLMDHKSHKSIPDDDQRFSDLQTVFYIWAYNRERPNSKADGILWDYIRTKPPVIPEILKNGGLSQRKNMDTDYHTYLGEVKRLDLNPADYAETLDRLVGERNTFFRRIFLPSPPQVMIDNIVKDMRTTAIMISKLGKTAITRNMTKDCSSMCEYYNLCQAELRGLDSKYVRKADYEEKEPQDHKFEQKDKEI